MHGTDNCYGYWKCRCAECTEAHRVKYRKDSEARKAREIPDDIHGKITTYSNWGCRCDLCRAANTQKTRERRR